jgi:hypothetical protein
MACTGCCQVGILGFAHCDGAPMMVECTHLQVYSSSERQKELQQPRDDSVSPDIAEYGLGITVQDPCHPGRYEVSRHCMSWPLYCEKGCHDIWLVTSDFSLDIEAVSSGDFAGQGGTGLCSKARDFTCWYDSVDLANITFVML